MDLLYYIQYTCCLKIKVKLLLGGSKVAERKGGTEGKSASGSTSTAAASVTIEGTESTCPHTRNRLAGIETCEAGDGTIATGESRVAGGG